MTVKKSSEGLDVTSPGEGVMGFAATKGTEVEVIVIMEGSTLRGGIRASDVPVDTEDLVVRCGKTKAWVTFGPNNLSISKFCRGGGLEMKEDSVPLMCTDKADGRGGRLAAA